MTRPMHLNLFIQSRGHHEASWRHPKSSQLPLTDIHYTVELAQKAEAGLFDSIFLADVLGLWNDVEKTPFNWLEPITTLAALADGDQAHRPDRDRVHDLHRALQPGAAVLLARPHQPRPDRLEHRHHLVAAGRQQLRRHRRRSATPIATSAPKNTWPWSRACGTAGPTTRCSTIAPAAATPIRARATRSITRARTTRSQGPLNLPRSPQGRPVFVQAGSSDTGRAFAARHAEAVFTAHLEKATAKAFYADLKSLVAEDGRDPIQVLILPGFSPIIGSTEAEARRFADELERTGRSRDRPPAAVAAVRRTRLLAPAAGQAAVTGRLSRSRARSRRRAAGPK